jgi:hypothetical protein
MLAVLDKLGEKKQPIVVSNLTNNSSITAKLQLDAELVCSDFQPLINTLQSIMALVIIMNGVLHSPLREYSSISRKNKEAWEGTKIQRRI